jgi:hypothetical protein
VHSRRALSFTQGRRARAPTGRAIHTLPRAAHFTDSRNEAESKHLSKHLSVLSNHLSHSSAVLRAIAHASRKKELRPGTKGVGFEGRTGTRAGVPYTRARLYTKRVGRGGRRHNRTTAQPHNRTTAQPRAHLGVPYTPSTQHSVEKQGSATTACTLGSAVHALDSAFSREAR